MRFETVVQKLFGQALAQLDARNARNMARTVRACLQGRRLVMMELARHWPSAIKVTAPLNDWTACWAIDGCMPCAVVSIDRRWRC